MGSLIFLVFQVASETHEPKKLGWRIGSGAESPVSVPFDPFTCIPQRWVVAVAVDIAVAEYVIARSNCLTHLP